MKQTSVNCVLVEIGWSRDAIRAMMTSNAQTWRNSGRFTAPRAAEAEAFSDDARLAADIRRRDPEAIRSVVHNYLPQMVRAAGASGLSPELADDVAQSTFQAFIEATSRFDGRSKARTFLFGILCRKIAEARREATRDRTVRPDRRENGGPPPNGRYMVAGTKRTRPSVVRFGNRTGDRRVSGQGRPPPTTGIRASRGRWGFDSGVVSHPRRITH